MNTISHCSHPPQPAGLGPNTAPGTARRPLALAITSLLLAGALGGEARAQAFPPVIELGSLSGADGFRLDGVAAGDYSGFSVAAAGDINGDGIDDLIIGAFGADPNGHLSGSIYVVFGKDTATAGDFLATLALSSLDGSNGFRLDGAAAFDFSGYSVASAGDINGDGIDDLIIGAPYADPNGSDSGSSYVVFGRDTVNGPGFPATLDLSSLDGSNGFRLDGVAAFDQSGRSVASAGDINGDGIDDLIVGALGADPNGNNNAGSSYVVFGRDTVNGPGFPATLDLSSLDGSNGFRLDGVAAGNRSGFSVAAAGDINGDGIDDLIIGAPLADPNGSASGSSYVVFGRDTATAGNFSAVLDLSDLDGSNGFRLDGVAAGDRSGRSVAAAGDINGDGIDDLIIGAPYADPNGSFSGSSYVVFGRDTVNGPGFPATLALSSLDGSNGFRLDGAAAGDYSGFSVAAAGDINGDGIDDLIIGAFGADPNGSYSGSSYVLFGRDTATQGDFPATLALSSLNGPSGFRLDGVAAFDQSGFSVAAAGDINGDGIGDLVVGAHRASPNGSNSGSSYVVFGRVTGLPVLNLDASLIDFGQVFVGSSAPAQTLTLGNPGSGLVSVNIIDLPNPAFALIGGSCGPLPIRIPVGENCTLDVQFTPQTTGQVLAQMTFASTSVTSPDSVFLLGTGLPVPVVSLLPNPLDFGDVALDATATEILIVENTGDGTLQPGALSITGPQAGDFSIQMNNCANAQLSSSQSCGIEIRFAPAGPGIRQATLSLQSNAPSSPDLVQLRGNNDALFADRFEVQ